MVSLLGLVGTSASLPRAADAEVCRPWLRHGCVTHRATAEARAVDSPELSTQEQT